MTRHDWIVSIYAGAACGGILWQFLFLFTKLGSTHSLTPSAVLTTVAAPIIVGIAGMLLFRSTGGTTGQRAGAAISIGAFIGFPVLAWVAPW